MKANTNRNEQQFPVIKKRYIFIVFIFIAISRLIIAQQLTSPIGIPLQLSGGFGDLRAGHFHAGIDVRTRSSEGHALLAVLNGYISRVSVSPGGYGLAVYVMHPDESILTVYGHLQRFTPFIAEIVKKEQYEKERFAVDISFNPETFPVKQGEIIGYSGNSGSSNGPHLHFEVRDIRTNEQVDPLTFYKSNIPDTQKPLVRGLKIYPIAGKGIVNGSYNKQNITFKLNANDQPVVSDTIDAWGEIGLGIRATDRMNGTTFSYGIKDVLLTVDGMELFRSYLDRLLQDESKFINSYTDFEEWSTNRTFYIKTFVDPGNNARFIASRNAGIININEERIYSADITLTDLYGNACIFSIKIRGKPQTIASPDTNSAELMRWYNYNLLNAKGIRMSIQRNSLYNSVYIHNHISLEEKFDAPVHTISPVPVPLHYPAQLSLFIDSVSAEIDARQFGIVQLFNSGTRMTWIGGLYRDGWIDTQIGELGVFTVFHDVNPPKITPLEPSKWREKNKISIRISDDLSGIESYRGEIDGAYALFEYDSKNALITYTFDSERLHPGDHLLRLAVTDRCGNKSEFSYQFSDGIK